MAVEMHETSIETDNEKKKEYSKLHEQLSTIQRHKKGKAMYVLSASMSALFALMFSFVLIDYTYSWFTAIAISIVFGIIVCCLISVYLYLWLDMRESSIRRKLIDYETDAVQSDVSEDLFKNSIQMSYKYLDQYYLQTREHAQRGFIVTVCVATFGAMLICGGIVAMFLGFIDPSYITCASGVITEFIAAIFFYLYNRTVSSMSKYHNKLVLSQNISIALRVAESLPSDDKIKAKNGIITELLKDVNVHLVKDNG